MTTTADIEVVCPGMLEVLSVGKGDLKLTIDGTPEDIEKGKAIIEEMLQKGYTLFVETPKGLTRVKKFNPKHMAYVVAALHEDADEDEVATTKGKGKVGEREIPVAGSKATAVGRTAGG